MKKAYDDKIAQFLKRKEEGLKRPKAEGVPGTQLNQVPRTEAPVQQNVAIQKTAGSPGGSEIPKAPCGPANPVIKARRPLPPDQDFINRMKEREEKRQKAKF